MNSSLVLLRTIPDSLFWRTILLVHLYIIPYSSTTYITSHSIICTWSTYLVHDANTIEFDDQSYGCTGIWRWNDNSKVSSSIRIQQLWDTKKSIKKESPKKFQFSILILPYPKHPLRANTYHNPSTSSHRTIDQSLIFIIFLNAECPKVDTWWGDCWSH